MIHRELSQNIFLVFRIKKPKALVKQGLSAGVVKSISNVGFIEQNYNL